MKTTKKALRIPVLFVAIAGLIITAFSSCSQDDDDCPAPNVLAVAHASVVNALPGSQPVNFYFDGNMVNYYGLPYGAGLDYINAYTGKRTIDVYDTQTNQRVTSGSVDFFDGKAYSVFLTGTETTPNLLVINDDLDQPSSGNAGVRLINLSADAPAVDLVIKQGPTLATNISYKGSSTFNKIAGANSYDIEIRQSGTDKVLSSLQNVKFRNGSLYTVLLEGQQFTNDGHVLTIKVQLNAAYIN